jgi:hypothetical protein
MSRQPITLKNPTGWFAAGREVTRAMALLSDGAFKVYMHVCLTADRSTGILKIAHRDLAVALKKSRRSIVIYLEEAPRASDMQRRESQESACPRADRGVRPLLALPESAASIRMSAKP